MLVNALRRFRESLRRVTDGAEAFLILTLFILCLDKVSTDHAKSPKPIRIHLNRTLTQAISLTDTINNVRHITAKIAGKVVSISEASIRTDLIFDDADGIDSLPNQAIFNAIQLMGYEGDLTVLTFNKALFSPQWRMRVLPQKSTFMNKPSPSHVLTSKSPNESLLTPILSKLVSTDRPIVSTDGSKVSTDEQVESTDGQIKGTEDQTKEEIATQASQTSTQTPTSMIFGDD
ncbi:hypothetical protein Tco_0355528 [Tanacetum coccineum]